jgi:hypothetical protein
VAPLSSARERPRLRDAIIDHLRREGSDSISGLARHLSAVEGAPVHRLTVAGYLMALADVGDLREVDRPPSKHYQLDDAQRHIGLHPRVGRIVADLHVPAPERATVVTGVLNHLLGRPIFEAELRHAGYPRSGPGIEEVEASDEVRREYRSLFRGTPAFEIPRADALLAARAAALRAGIVQEVVRHVVLAGIEDAARFALQRSGPASVQTHLSLEDTG